MLAKPIQDQPGLFVFGWLTRSDFRVVLIIVMYLVTAKTPFEGIVSFNDGHSKGKQNDQIHI